MYKMNVRKNGKLLLLKHFPSTVVTTKLIHGRKSEKIHKQVKYDISFMKKKKTQKCIRAHNNNLK